MSKNRTGGLEREQITLATKLSKVPTRYVQFLQTFASMNCTEKTSDDRLECTDVPKCFEVSIYIKYREYTKQNEKWQVIDS